MLMWKARFRFSIGCLLYVCVLLGVYVCSCVCGVSASVFSLGVFYMSVYVCLGMCVHGYVECALPFVRYVQRTLPFLSLGFFYVWVCVRLRVYYVCASVCSLGVLYVWVYVCVRTVVYVCVCTCVCGMRASGC